MRTLRGTQQPPLNACETDLNLAPCFSPIDFLGGLDSKESACNAGDPGSIPGSIQKDALETGEATHSSICGLL